MTGLSACLDSEGRQTVRLAHFDSCPGAAGAGKDTVFSVANARTVREFHRSIPGYAMTPLVPLKDLAAELGLAGMYVKDESFRFGLNAFKGLGGSYCLNRYLEENRGSSGDKGKITFVTATDGNHGRGVAWAAEMAGHKAVVYLPKGSAAERLENIRRHGAHAEITELNYDDTVRFAAEQAEKNGWVLVQDTAWEGYEKIPTWIMQGYMTIGLEAAGQLDGRRPTHIFLQAGVGAMSGALASFFTDFYGADKPVITIVEPDQADCIYRTALADDGTIREVDGDLATIMAGLACGVPCSIGWKELRRCAENFVSLPDCIAAKGMRVLGNPAGGDRRIISGESGAVTAGFVCELMQNERLAEIRRSIGLGEHSVVLCVSTEGDTDRENYRRIVWDGRYPSCS